MLLNGMDKLKYILGIAVVALSLSACSSGDDDNDGKVMLYFPAVIKDGKLKCDLDKIVVNK